MSVLTITDLSVFHGQLRAVAGFNLELDVQQTVGVIGANGAGKTSLMRCIAGTLPATGGNVRLNGEVITAESAQKRVERGIASVPEGRRLFGSLSVEDNLLTGMYPRRSGQWTLDAIYDLFDWMPARRNQKSSQLSGGEQQAVAIGRALLSNPSVLLMDELSLGLAPIVVKRIYSILPQITAGHCAILLIEQDVSQAMSVADHVHCLLEGRTVLSGAPSELDFDAVETAYFGVDSPKAE